MRSLFCSLGGRRSMGEQMEGGRRCGGVHVRLNPLRILFHGPMDIGTVLDRHETPFYAS